MLILGIETSCDETGVAIYDEYKGLLINRVYSQKKLHSNYGGVIPELAARDHIKKIVPLILDVLKSVSLEFKNISGIAYTAGPGLIGSLLVGATISKTIAYVWKIPSISVHHMEAHLLMPMLENDYLLFPFLALLVSGGHTQLVYADSIGKYKILGETVDDSVGEVFDKVANLLGIKYPGGELLSKMARLGQPNVYNFPRPMINSPGLNFSFSGLKTSVINVITSLKIHNMEKYANIASSFEDAIIDVLVIKCKRALLQTGLTRLVVSGGVSANDILRLRLSKMLNEIKGKLFYSQKEFCTDNAAMIAYAGYIKFFNNYSYDDNNKEDLSILVRPKWSLEKL